MSNVEDEETTFLAANSDNWALETGSIADKCHRAKYDSPFAFFQRFQQADDSILFLNQKLSAWQINCEFLCLSDSIFKLLGLL
jgi:hypothetical protein